MTRQRPTPLSQKIKTGESRVRHCLQSNHDLLCQNWDERTRLDPVPRLSQAERCLQHLHACNRPGPRGHWNNEAEARTFVVNQLQATPGHAGRLWSAAGKGARPLGGPMPALAKRHACPRNCLSTCRGERPRKQQLRWKPRPCT